MIQLNFDRKALRQGIAFVFIIFSIILFPGSIVHAAKKIGYYSYKNIYNNIPKANQTDTYLYTEGDMPYISFATYNQKDYKMTVKRTEGEKDYLYCMDNTKVVDFDKNYSVKTNLFNDTLREKLTIAFYYGASKWKGQANEQFTTGNTILDYYMTQTVVHALIYKYGDDKSNYGIDYSKITFKSGTGNLSKKTEAFYKFCCNTDVDIISSEFRFRQMTSPYFYLESNMLVTPFVECDTAPNNSAIEYVRRVTSKEVAEDAISIEANGNTYNSPCRLKFPITIADKLSPGLYSVSLSESVAFNQYIAEIWQSTDTEHISQEIGGLQTDSTNSNDSITFSLLIGDVSLYKTDSVTGETISDAVFQLQQFNDTTQQYVFYKYLSYNAATQRYESGNIYQSVNNVEGKFRVVEEKSGANYQNDWPGAVFQINDRSYSHVFEVENQPVLGKLRIQKSGENIQFSDSGFIKTDNISLDGVKFGLYAKEDIYLKGKLFVPKDKKIADLITDSSGVVSVDDLLSGQYYFKEEETNPLYDIDPEIHSFEIKRDSNRKYSEVSQQIINNLKPCRIRIFKYYYDKSDTEKQDRIPLEGARFGLYAAADIQDAHGKLILAKDTLIQGGVSDKEGFIVYDNLPYGDYYIKELEAPEDFILNDGIVAISKEEFQYDDILKEYVCEKEYLNQKQNFKIQIIKTGEAFSGILQNTSEQGEYFQYQLQSKSLQNVEFSLYSKKDDSLVATAITDEQGVAEYTGIEPGSYYAIESAAPGEYKLNTEKIYIECKADDKNYNPLDPPVFKVSVDNQLCNCNLQLFKKGEHVKVGKKGLLYEQIPLSGIVFGIYQNFEYTFSSGEKLSQDSCVGYIVTDQNGNDTLIAKLPIGNYYLKEIKTNLGYELDMNTYPFEVQPNCNQDITIQVGNGNTFVNQLSKAAVEIIKTDANTGKKLKNVEFTLYNNKDEKIGVYRTNSKGRILVEQLPYGKYYFIETKCKNGYYSSNNKYRFELASAETVTLNITNTPILQLGFAEHYKAGLIGCLAIILCLLKTVNSGHGCILFLRKKKSDWDDIY